MKIELIKNRLIKPRVITALIFIIFTGIHYTEVKLVAEQSGDGFLKPAYLCLALLMLFTVIGSAYLLDQAKADKLPLCRSFAASALLLGIGYMYVFQGLSAPDEISHYISAYKLSSQWLGAEATAEDGHVIVREQDYFLGDLNDEAGKTGAARILGEDLGENDFRIIKNWNRLYPFKNSEVMRISLYPPVNTTPLVYIPQAFGITLARLLGFNSIAMLNFGKFFNLLIYIIIMSYAISLMPFAEKVLYGAALLPMSLHLAASMSYDAMLLSVTACFFAKILNLAVYNQAPAKKIEFKDIAFLAVLTAVFAPCKIIYSPLILAYFIIPAKNFKNKKYCAAGFIILSAALIISMMLINSVVIKNYAEAKASTVGWNAEAGFTFAELLHRPFFTLSMLYKTVLLQLDYYHFTMIGAYLGNINKVLNIPYLAVILFTLGLLILALPELEKKESFKLSIGKRLLLLFIIMVVSGGALLSMFIAWTPRSAMVISGVQGRYFLPVLVPALLLIDNSFIVCRSDRSNTVLCTFIWLNAYSLIRLFALVCLRVNLP